MPSQVCPSSCNNSKMNGCDKRGAQHVRRCPEGVGGGTPEGWRNRGRRTPFTDNTFGRKAQVSTHSQLQPLGNRLTLKLVAAPQRVGSIWIPPGAERNFQICQGEVVAVGHSVRDSRLLPGAVVICRRFGGVALDDDKTLWTIGEGDVLAVFEHDH